MFVSFRIIVRFFHFCPFAAVWQAKSAGGKSGKLNLQLSGLYLFLEKFFIRRKNMARARLMKKEKIFIDELAEKGGRPLYELTPAAARPGGACRRAERREGGCCGYGCGEDGN